MKQKASFKIRLFRFFGIIFVFLIILALYVVFIEPNLLFMTKKNIVLKNFPPSFAGIKAAHISDFHFGAFTGINSVRRVVRAVNNLKPDIIFVTGDFIDVTEKEKICLLADEVAKLKAKYGTFAVLGNHDHWMDAPFLKARLTQKGIRVLDNESVKITNGRESIYIVGVDDPYLEKDDLVKALTDTPPGGVKILLAHSPQIIPQAVEKNIDLVLAGHVHGGQAKVPFLYKQVLPVPDFAKKYSGGYYTIGNTQMYVNRGIGMFGLPLRFLSPPEIAVFVLK